jgi:hypothetical protein
MCNLSAGFELDTCADGHGGIKSLRVLGIDKVGSITTSIAGLVTGIVTKPTTAKFFLYNLKKETAGFKEDENTNDENGTVEYVQSIDAKMNKLGSVKRKELSLLAQVNTVIIVEDNNGKFYLMGEKFGMTKSGSRESGKSFADFNGHMLSFKGKELESFKEVDPSIITALTFV